jgi:hypothetical protein
VLTAAKETSPVSIGNDIRYTGFYVFWLPPFFRRGKKKSRNPGPAPLAEKASRLKTASRRFWGWRVSHQKGM